MGVSRQGRIVLVIKQILRRVTKIMNGIPTGVFQETQVNIRIAF